MRHAFQVSIGLPSANFCAALFDIYIGDATVVPAGRKQWAEAALALMKGV